MLENTSSSFKLTTTGEALRGFFNLRIGAIDRNIARYEQALVVAREDLQRVKVDTDQQFARAQERAVHTAGMGNHRHGGFVPGGIDQFATAASAIAKVEYELAQVRDQRATSVWLRDQITDDRYVLSTGDLMALGLAEFSIGPMMGRAMGSALDQLTHYC